MPSSRAKTATAKTAAAKTAAAKTAPAKGGKTAAKAAPAAEAPEPAAEAARPSASREGVRAAFARGGLAGFRQTLRRLYHGRSRAARRFQLSVIVIDVAIIAFFILSPLLPKGPVFYWIDYSVALLLLVDLGARALASHNAKVWLRQPTTLVDIFILVTMLAPLWLANLGFLRVLRIWTLSQTDFVWTPLRRSRHRAWEDPVRAMVSLITFLFVVTGFVYTFFSVPVAPGAAADDKLIHNYVDALYFTVATVTTTGFGDITLPGPWGKLTSVIVMIVGISLFVRLAQAIFRPSKVTYRCPTCALMKHDYDAVHCKACGEILCIPDEDD